MISWSVELEPTSPQVSPTLLEFQTQATFTSMCCQWSWSVWYKCSQAGPPISSAQVSKPRQPSQQLSPTHFHLNDFCNILQFNHLAAICCLVQGWDAQYWLSKSGVKFKWHLYNANPQHLPAIQALQSVQFLVKSSQGLFAVMIQLLICCLWHPFKHQLNCVQSKTNLKTNHEHYETQTFG